MAAASGSNCDMVSIFDISSHITEMIIEFFIYCVLLISLKSTVLVNFKYIRSYLLQLHILVNCSTTDEAAPSKTEIALVLAMKSSIIRADGGRHPRVNFASCDQNCRFWVTAYPGNRAGSSLGPSGIRNCLLVSSHDI